MGAVDVASQQIAIAHSRWGGESAFPAVTKLYAMQCEVFWFDIISHWRAELEAGCVVNPNCDRSVIAGLDSARDTLLVFTHSLLESDGEHLVYTHDRVLASTAQWWGGIHLVANAVAAASHDAYAGSWADWLAHGETIAEEVAKRALELAAKGAKLAGDAAGWGLDRLLETLLRSPALLAVAIGVAWVYTDGGKRVGFDVVRKLKG